MSVGVLASGTGSILAAILESGIPVSVVVCDRLCPAVEVAFAAGTSVEVIERGPVTTPDFDRRAYTQRVVDVLLARKVSLVAMAGFMTIMERPILEAFPRRVLNTHPSLLPAFPGAHAVPDALKAGVKVTGCTIHLAGPQVDAGRILAQEAVPVLPGDTEESLHERIKQVERRLYPEVIRSLLEPER